MRLIFGFLLMLAVAGFTGLGLTWINATHGASFGALRIGPWVAQPKTGTSSIDPYAQANIARSGTLPLGSGDGVAFIAATDRNGKALDGRCSVVISGETPPARYWTMTLHDAQGRIIANGLNRHGFTSAEAVRDARGLFTVTLAPRARGGNWLPTGGIQSYKVVLRLYDTSVGIALRSERDAPMPDIITQDCP